MKTKEIEERVLISEEQYTKIEKYLKENFSHITITHQKNRYFDDKDRTIKRIRNVLRIRSFRSCKERELTYKVKGTEGDFEYTQMLSHYWFYQITRFSRLPDGIVKDTLIKDGVDVNSLTMLVDLYTKRMEVKCNDYLLVLDANMYNGINDYNIEIESNVSKKHAKEIILKYCEMFGLTYSDNYVVKSRRAFESLKK